MVRNELKRLMSLVSTSQYRKVNIPSGAIRVSINNYCNMRCDYCHNEGQDHGDLIDMSIGEFKHIAVNATRFGVKDLRLTGGEPTLHPDLYEMCRFIKESTNIQTLGINSNGILLDNLQQIVGYVDRIVIGLDCYNSVISKKSDLGIDSKTVMSNILTLAKNEVAVEVASVVNDFSADVSSLVEWCFKHGITIKLIEKSNTNSSTRNSDKDCNHFVDLIKNAVDEFDLTIGYDRVLREYTAYSDSGGTVKFFHSHCNLHECSTCLFMPLRISADSFAIPCMCAEERYTVLGHRFEEGIVQSLLYLQSK